MKLLSIVAASLAAVSGTAIAQAQTGAWEYFDAAGGMSGARVSGTGGTLVIKCDKPGRKEVYAMIVSKEAKLALPVQRPPSRPITYKFDAKSPTVGNWGFYEKYATALGKTGDQTLSRFVVELRKASKLGLRLDTGMSSDVTMDFDVTGAGEAIAHVYQACKDTAPA